jgi:hypothetical protein
MTQQTSGTTRRNAYERRSSQTLVKPWAQFTRDQLTGGEGAHNLGTHLRQYVPGRTSRFHETVQSDSGTPRDLMAAIGYPATGHGWTCRFCKPGQAEPSVYTDGGSYLYWSTSDMPGVIAKVPVSIEGVGSVELFVADVVSIVIAHKYGGDEAAMIADYLKEAA